MNELHENGHLQSEQIWPWSHQLIYGLASDGWLPVVIYRATDTILNSKFAHFFSKGILDLILTVEMF
jgi:hypothetical protein